MNIATTEQAIIDRLTAQIANIKVEGYPDDPLTYKLIHPNGALLVQYEGSGFSAPEDYNFVQQREKALFSVIVVTKNLRTHTGAYAFIESVKTKLTGYLIPNLKKLYLVRIKFLSDEGGIWRYEVAFALNVRHSEA